MRRSGEISWPASLPGIYFIYIFSSGCCSFKDFFFQMSNGSRLNQVMKVIKKSFIKMILPQCVGVGVLVETLLQVRKARR